MGWTAGYVLENENGERCNLTAPAPIFMVDVEGLGAVGDPAFAPLGDGFFLLTDDERSRESITGDLIYQEGAYGNYQNLVNWLMAAGTLIFCYTPLEDEFRRVVKLRYINKDRRNSGGIMRAAISFDPLTPWYQATNAELEISVTEANVKEYAYDDEGDPDDEDSYGYVYGIDDPTADDPDELVYGGEAAADMSAVIYPIGHEPAAFLLRYTGAIENPIIRLVGQDTGEVYGICDVAVTLAAGESIELCTQRENSYIKKIAANGTESSLLNDVNLSFDPYFRAPVTEPAVISIESNAPITGAASLTVYNYYRSV